MSGNAAGRPKGSRNRILAALDKIGEDAAGEVLKKAVEAAKGGDMRAIEAVLSRVWPARKGRPVRLALPALETAADLPAALASVAAAVARGEVTPEEGQAVGALLEAHRRAVETADLAARLDALERRQGR
jgi:hypothetical protein